MNGINDLESFLLTLGLAVPRILAAFTMLPFLSRQVLPGLVRHSVAVSMALILVPFLLPTMSPQDMALQSILLLLVKEVTIGLLLGFFAAILFYVVQSIGTIIDYQRGAEVGSMLNVTSGGEDTPTAILLFQAVVAFFFASGGFLVFLGALYESYRLWPITAFLPALSFEAASVFVSQFQNLFAAAVLLAAPAMIAMFLVELAMGLVGRFAPQLNVFFLSMPVKSAVGLLVLLLYGAFFFRDLQQRADLAPDLVNLMMRAL